MDMEHQWQDGSAVALCGLRPVHPDPEPATRQCHLMPLDLGAEIGIPGDHPRHPAPSSCQPPMCNDLPRTTDLFS